MNTRTQLISVFAMVTPEAGKKIELDNKEGNRRQNMQKRRNTHTSLEPDDRKNCGEMQKTRIIQCRSNTNKLKKT